MVCTDTIDTVSEKMLAVSSHDRNIHPERDYIEEEATFRNCTKRCEDIAEHRNCGTNMLRLSWTARIAAHS